MKNAFQILDGLGVPVKLLPETYLSTGTITPTASMFGTPNLSIIQHNPTADDTNCITVSSVDDITISGITVKNEETGAGDYYTLRAFYVENSDNVTIENCQAIGAWNSNRQADWVGPTNTDSPMIYNGFVLDIGTTNSTVRGCYAEKNYVAYRHEDNNDCTITGNKSYDTYRAFMFSTDTGTPGALRNTMSNNVFVEAKQAGTKVEDKCYYNIIENNIFTDCLQMEVDNGGIGSAVVAAFGESTIIRNNTIVFETAPHTSHTALFILGNTDQGEYSQFTGNVIRGLTTTDHQIVKATNAIGWIISDNIIEVDDADDVMLISSCLNSTISGNKIFISNDTADAGIAVRLHPTIADNIRITGNLIDGVAYGIEINYNSGGQRIGRFIVTDNVIQNAATSGIYIRGTDGCIIKGNVTENDGTRSLNVIDSTNIIVTDNYFNGDILFSDDGPHRFDSNIVIGSVSLAASPDFNARDNICYGDYRMTYELTTETFSTFTDGDASPDVTDYNYWLTAGTTTITDIDGGKTGQVIVIIAETSITIEDAVTRGGNIWLDGSADWAMTASDSLTLMKKSTGAWVELARGDNGL